MPLGINFSLSYAGNQFLPGSDLTGEEKVQPNPIEAEKPSFNQVLDLTDDFPELYLHLLLEL